MPTKKLEDLLTRLEADLARGDALALSPDEFRRIRTAIANGEYAKRLFREARERALDGADLYEAFPALRSTRFRMGFLVPALTNVWVKAQTFWLVGWVLHWKRQSPNLSPPFGAALPTPDNPTMRPAHRTIVGIYKFGGFMLYSTTIFDFRNSAWID